MGKQQSKIAPEVMNDLRANTNFTDKEIVDWYDGFKKDCPTGRLDVTEFKETFKSEHFYLTVTRIHGLPVRAGNEGLKISQSRRWPPLPELFPG